MKLIMCHIAQRGRSSLFEQAEELYVDRLKRYATLERVHFRTEEALLTFTARQRSRTPLCIVLLDAAGKHFRSEQFARWLGTLEDSGRQAALFAVGPADGWSPKAHAEAQLTLSLGPMTLSHELARVVLLEQIYRAFTILAGHPYHTGH